MRKVDNRNLVEQTAYSYYPNGIYKHWGETGYDTRRDFFRSTYQHGDKQTVEWTEGTIVRTREEIMELVKCNRDKSTKAVFKTNPYT